MQPGGRGASVVAYDAATGKPVWKALDDMQAYVSPMLVTLAGRRQIVTITGNRAIGVSVDDGSLLWSYPWATDNAINVSQPIVLGPSRLFLSSGYGKGAAAIELTRVRRAARRSTTLWQHTRMKNKLSSSVLLDGYVYGLDEGILSCVDAATGQRGLEGRPLRARPAAPRRRSPADHRPRPASWRWSTRRRRLRGAGARARDRGPHLERAGDRGRHPARP